MRIGISVKMRKGGYDRFGDEKYNKIKSYGFDCVDFDGVLSLEIVPKENLPTEEFEQQSIKLAEIARSFDEC